MNNILFNKENNSSIYDSLIKIPSIMNKLYNKGY